LPEPTRSVLLIGAAEEAGELAVTLRAAAQLDLPPDALDPADGVIESNCGSLLDGAATMKQALALSEDPSLTLEILRDGCAMASQAGAHDDARAVAEQAARVADATEFERFTKTSLAAWAADLSGDYVSGNELSAELGELAEPLEVSICMIWAALAATRAGLRQASLHHGNRAVALARDQGDVTRHGHTSPSYTRGWPKAAQSRSSNTPSTRWRCCIWVTAGPVRRSMSS